MKFNKNNIVLSKKHVFRIIHSSLWFLTGFIFAGIFLGSFLFVYFQNNYKDRAIPGVFIGNTYVGEKKKEELYKMYEDKNKKIGENNFTLTYKDEVSPYNDYVATLSAKTLGIGYNSKLIADQAVSVGKSKNIISNLYLTINSYLSGTFLQASYTFNKDIIKNNLSPLQKKIYKDPVDALFSVTNNRVSAFRQSEDGLTIDYEKLEKDISEKISYLALSSEEKNIYIPIPIRRLKPQITTEKANNFGIVEEIGSGVSYFANSIPNRVYNITLASSRINGILVAPNEEFSFDKYLGDVSKLTGYKEAYVIQNGKTVLGDGGGVCQVSTTLFRAILNAGLPITERNAHSYRVGYYEQNSYPGFDATIFWPSVDLKFKNDTGNYILIQNTIDPNTLQIVFTLYGKRDNREVTISTPVITSQSPAPPPLYQDDPTLPKGTVKQIDFEAVGANVVFKRIVKKNGTTIINEAFNSRYSPWRAVFLKGTKE